MGLDHRIDTEVLAEQKRFNDDTNKRFHDVSKLVKENIERLVRLQGEVKRMNKHQENTDERLHRLTNKFEALKQDMQHDMQKQKDDFKERLEDIDAHYKQKIEELNNDLEKFS